MKYEQLDKINPAKHKRYNPLSYVPSNRNINIKEKTKYKKNNKYLFTTLFASLMLWRKCLYSCRIGIKSILIKRVIKKVNKKTEIEWLFAMKRTVILVTSSLWPFGFVLAYVCVFLLFISAGDLKSGRITIFAAKDALSLLPYHFELYLTQATFWYLFCMFLTLVL